MPKDRYRHNASTGFRIGQLLPISDSLVTAVLGADYATTRPLHKQKKTPGPRATNEHVALVCEVRRLHKRGWTLGQISQLLDANNIFNTLGTLSNWVNELTCVKNYPVVKAEDKCYLELTRGKEIPTMKIERERINLLRLLIEEAGLTFDRYTQNNREGMISAKATYKGETRTFMISMTDKRTDRLEQSRMEQFKREMDSPSIAPAPIKPIAAALTEAIKKAAEVPAEPDSDIEKYRVAVHRLIPPKVESMTAHKKPGPPKGTIVSKNGLRLGRVSMADQYKLIEWMKATDMMAFDSLASAIAAGAQHIGVHVSDKLFNEALQLAGKEVKRKMTPMHAASQHQKIIASELLRLMRELNVEPAPELRAIVEN